MKVLVLGGAGAVCNETTRDLVQYGKFDEIVVAEHNLDAANQLIKEIDDPRLKSDELKLRGITIGEEVEWLE